MGLTRIANIYFRLMNRLRKIFAKQDYEVAPSIPSKGHEFIYTVKKISREGVRREQIKRKSDSLHLPCGNQPQPVFSLKDCLLSSNPKDSYNHLLPSIFTQQPPKQRGKLIKFRTVHRVTSQEAADSPTKLTVGTAADTEEDGRKSVDIEQLLSSAVKSLGEKKIFQESINYRKSPKFSAGDRSLYLSKGVKNSEEDQSDEEYIKEAIVGPGAYEYAKSDFTKKSCNRSTNHSFLSRATRFKEKKTEEYPNPPQDALDKLQLKEEQPAINSSKGKLNLAPFGSKADRLERIKESFPGPFDYCPRLGIEQDLIRNIQHNFRSNFSSYEPRFFQMKGNQSDLGPAQYPVPTKDIPSKPDYFFASNLRRFE